MPNLERLWLRKIIIIQAIQILEMPDAPSLQGKMGKPSNDWFEYLIIDKDDPRVREMCTKLIIKGKWPKLEQIFMGIFQINLD